MIRLLRGGVRPLLGSRRAEAGRRPALSRHTGAVDVEPRSSLALQSRNRLRGSALIMAAGRPIALICVSVAWRCRNMWRLADADHGGDAAQRHEWVRSQAIRAQTRGSGG
jgi:hypothetical protein